MKRIVLLVVAMTTGPRGRDSGAVDRPAGFILGRATGIRAGDHPLTALSRKPARVTSGLRRHDSHRAQRTSLAQLGNLAFHKPVALYQVHNAIRMNNTAEITSLRIVLP